MQTIKITSANKGKIHWESYLLAKQKIRLQKLLTQLDVNPWTKRKVIHLFKSKVNTENIIPISQSNIRVFLHHLLHDELDYLIKNTIS